MNYLDIQFRESPDLFRVSSSFRLYEKQNGKYSFKMYECVANSNLHFKGFHVLDNNSFKNFLEKLNLEYVVQSFLDKMNLFAHEVQFQHLEFKTAFNRIKNELMFELKRDIHFNFLLKIIAESYHDDFLILRSNIGFFKYEKFNVIRLIDSLLESFYHLHVNTK
jgi:hypothetical protein